MTKSELYNKTANKTFTFVGTKKPLSPRNGDTYHDAKTNKDYVYFNRKWEPLEPDNMEIIGGEDAEISDHI